MKERTLIIVKPDAICQRVVGKIIGIIEEQGLRILALRMLRLKPGPAQKFYRDHKGKHFYKPLVYFMSSNPVIPAVVEGAGAIKKMRELCGRTNPVEAKPMTIRRMFARDNRHNIIHASDSPASAKREIAFFFSSSEIHNWKPINYHL
ncbi:MAG TPA: nucleoside-diphosphate kinase [bacterium]|nr:nucleoside-diphosphate kinase [bacterium]